MHRVLFHGRGWTKRMDPKIDFGNGIIVKEAIMENAAYISIEAITKVIPKEYLYVAVLKEILGIAKDKTETMLISSFQKCLEEQKRWNEIKDVAIGAINYVNVYCLPADVKMICKLMEGGEKMEQSRNCTINNTEEMTEKQIDVSLIRVDSRFFLKVYEAGIIPISDYKIQSSADGETELCITISGEPSELELSASLIQLMK